MWAIVRTRCLFDIPCPPRADHVWSRKLGTCGGMEKMQTSVGKNSGDSVYHARLGAKYRVTRPQPSLPRAEFIDGNCSPAPIEVFGLGRGPSTLAGSWVMRSSGNQSSRSTSRNYGTFIGPLSDATLPCRWVELRLAGTQSRNEQSHKVSGARASGLIDCALYHTFLQHGCHCDDAPAFASIDCLHSAVLKSAKEVLEHQIDTPTINIQHHIAIPGSLVVYRRPN